MNAEQRRDHQTYTTSVRSNLKGHDDLWELDLGTSIWTLRIESMYTILCAVETQPDTVEETFCINYDGLAGISLASSLQGYLYFLGGNHIKPSINT
jgi:hypothetical protein